MMNPQPDLKKRKVDSATALRAFPTRPDDKDTARKSIDTLNVPAAQSSSSFALKIQQAKNFAVAQAQQEGCTGNYRIFDSSFGNFLVPVIPTRAELGG